MSEDAKLKKLKQNKVRYRKRKAAGLCSHGICTAKVELGHAHCAKHLEAMAEHATRKRKERITQNLCLYCGKRPQFWGRKCIICRQLFATDPLPTGARRALRLYREAERRREKEQKQGDARQAAFKLIASGQIQGRSAEALYLYAGIDTGSWRTYKEVAQIMKLSTERVRQLLLPAKLILKATFSGRAPWRPVEWQQMNGRMVPSENDPRTKHQSFSLRTLDHESYLYEGCGLPNVVLFGLTANRCKGCDCQKVCIPCVDDLHSKLARAILLKATALTGQELRFLRSTAGLIPVMLAERLGVTFQTVLGWEESNELRGPNDLAARMIIASVISTDECGSQIFEIFRSIRWRTSEALRINAHWMSGEGQWLVNSRGKSNPQ